MSKGPGKTQIKILEVLKAYKNIGASMQWEFNPGASWMAVNADTYDIESYERCEIVPVWIIRRDTGIDKTAISRAIKGLDRMGYIFKRGADLDLAIGDGRLYICTNTKFVQLTQKGIDWFKRQQSKKNKVDA